MSRYPHRYLIVVPADSVEATKALFVAISGDEEQAMPEGIGYSVSGDAPASHYAASGVVTEQQRQMLEAVEGSGQLPGGLIYFRTGNDRDSILMKTNHYDKSLIGQSVNSIQLANLLNLQPVAMEVLDHE